MGDYGSRIKTAREAANMTQEQLGKYLGVTGVTIMRYEKNQREPRLEQLQKIAEILEVSFDYLLNGSTIQSTHFAGLHVFRDNNPQSKVSLDLLKDYEDNSYSILYQDDHTLIAADTNSPLSIDQIRQIAKIYVDNDFYIDEDDKDFVAWAMTLPKPEDLPNNLVALKSLMNVCGYDLEKVSGNYYFSGKSGGHQMTEHQVSELLHNTTQYISFLCSKIEQTTFETFISEKKE